MPRRQLYPRSLPLKAYQLIKSAGSLAAAIASVKKALGYLPSMSTIKSIYNKTRLRSGGRLRPAPGSPLVASPKRTSVKKEIRKLKQIAEADRGTLIYRDRQVSALSSSVNQTGYNEHNCNGATVLETVLGQLRYYNPSAPSSLVTADGTTGTYSKDFVFDTMHFNLVARNNYQVPVECTIYYFRVKVDTNITPNTAFSNGLTDVSSAATTSPLTFVTDSDQVTTLWTIVKSKKRVLNPGTQMSLIHTEKSIKYDPSLHDSHNLEYNRKHRSIVSLVRVEGVIGHDTSAAERGFLQAGVDYYIDKKFVVNYQAGADIKWIHVNNSSSTFTNAGVVSSKPVSDNLSYSVA